VAASTTYHPIHYKLSSFFLAFHTKVLKHYSLFLQNLFVIVALLFFVKQFCALLLIEDQSFSIIQPFPKTLVFLIAPTPNQV